VVRAASPALLRVIALGAFFIYCTVSKLKKKIYTTIFSCSINRTKVALIDYTMSVVEDIFDKKGKKKLMR
jgi:hypothetical protein